MTRSIQPLPTGLADVALIDAATAAQVGGMSPSWWAEEVRSGRAPQPVIRGHRCTRWRLADVRGFWETRAKRPIAVSAVALDGTNLKERGEK